MRATQLLPLFCKLTVSSLDKIVPCTYSYGPTSAHPVPYSAFSADQYLRVDNHIHRAHESQT